MMIKKSNTVNKQLRSKAEAFLRTTRDDIANMSIGDIQELVYELQVHQVELKMQNEELLEAQLQLEKSRNKYTDLYDFAPVGYITMDQMGVISEANLMACTMLGLNRAELIGKKASQFVDLESQDILYVHARQVFYTHEKQSCELKLTSDDGKLLYVQLSSIYIEGSEDLILTAISDITERVIADEKLRRSEERFQLAIEGINDGIWDYDLLEDKLYLSPRYKSMLGYEDDELENLTDSITGLLHPDDREIGQDKMAGYKSGSADGFKDIFRLRHKNGDYRWIMCRGIIVKNSFGHAIRMTGSHTDITALKHLEYRLTRARDRAKAASLAKSQFLANMSHEIRTPLNAIIGISHILEKTKPLNNRQKNFITVLKSSCDSLLSLINELLDISKIEANTFELESMPFNLPDIVSETVKMMAVKAEEKQLILEVNNSCDPNRNYYGDPHRIKQILVNLLSNAIKFTEQGKIGLSLSERQNAEDGRMEVTISVKDTGIGISKSKHADIFKKFTQADASTTRKYGGTGLGLAICKELVTYMNGTIEINSREGEGSTFVITLPLEISYESAIGLNAVQPSEAATETKAKAKVLLVEDYAANVMIATAYLSNFDFEYDVASNGNEAISRFNTDKYSVILMDVQMPGMDGFEATKQIRELEKSRNLPRTPIIAMTAHAFTDDREKCLDAGMDDYISKPFNPKELKNKIEKLFNAE